MSIKTRIGATLTAIVLAASIGLTTGCRDINPKYHFDGFVGEEKVSFYETHDWANSNFLQVTKPNGRVLLFRDANKDLTVDSVKVWFDGKYIEYLAAVKYKPDEVGELVIKEAQKQFDAYLSLILERKKQLVEEKQQEGISLLK